MVKTGPIESLSSRKKGLSKQQVENDLENNSRKKTRSYQPLSPELKR